MGRIIEGIWTCKACGTSGIRASNKVCPHCGAVQESYSLPEEALANIGSTASLARADYVDKETAEKARNSGPDWYCSFCERLNPSTSSFCEGCGSSKADSQKNYFDRKREKELAAIKNANKKLEDALQQEQVDMERERLEKREISPEGLKQEKRKQEQLRKIRSFFKKASPYLIGIAVILSVVFGTCFCFSTKDAYVSVKELSWERSIAVEEYKTVHESGWMVPAGARDVTSREEIYTYRQVLDHYEKKTVQKSREVVDHYEEVVTGYRDLGNGFYEEQTSSQPVYKTEYYTETVEEPVYVQEPVYETKYYYDIDKWVVTDHIKTSGSDKNPYYGERALKSNERYGTKTESYSVVYVNEKGKTDVSKLSFQEWNSIEPDGVIHVKVDIFGNIKEILYDG